MANYKQLCAELVHIADALDSGTELASNQGQAMDGYSALAAFRDVAHRARAALAEPEPEVPTDEDLFRLDQLRDKWNAQADAFNTWDELGIDEIVWWAQRQALARWGNHPGSPDSSLQPVPVSERLPEPEDCNDEGEVWAWRRFSRFSLEKDIDNCDFWCLAYHKWLEGEDCGFTHWLPAHALPLPTHA